MQTPSEPNPSRTAESRSGSSDSSSVYIKQDASDHTSSEDEEMGRLRVQLREARRAATAARAEERRQRKNRKREEMATMILREKRNRLRSEQNARADTGRTNAAVAQSAQLYREITFFEASLAGARNAKASTAMQEGTSPHADDVGPRFVSSCLNTPPDGGDGNTVNGNGSPGAVSQEHDEPPLPLIDVDDGLCSNSEPPRGARENNSLSPSSSCSHLSTRHPNEVQENRTRRGDTAALRGNHTRTTPPQEHNHARDAAALPGAPESDQAQPRPPAVTAFQRPLRHPDLAPLHPSVAGSTTSVPATKSGSLVDLTSARRLRIRSGPRSPFLIENALRAVLGNYLDFPVVQVLINLLDPALRETMVWKIQNILTDHPPAQRDLDELMHRLEQDWKTRTELQNMRSEAKSKVSKAKMRTAELTWNNFLFDGSPHVDVGDEESTPRYGYSHAHNPDGPSDVFKAFLRTKHARRFPCDLHRLIIIWRCGEHDACVGCGRKREHFLPPGVEIDATGEERLSYIVQWKLNRQNLE